MQNDEHVMTWARSQENPMPLILKLLLQRKGAKSKC
jgi:hypothetical protein